MYEFAKLLDEAVRGRKRVSRLYVNTFWEAKKEREDWDWRCSRARIV